MSYTKLQITCAKYSNRVNVYIVSEACHERNIPICAINFGIGSLLFQRGRSWHCNWNRPGHNLFLVCVRKLYGYLLLYGVRICSALVTDRTGIVLLKFKP